MQVCGSTAWRKTHYACWPTFRNCIARCCTLWYAQRRRHVPWPCHIWTRRLHLVSSSCFTALLPFSLRTVSSRTFKAQGLELRVSNPGVMACLKLNRLCKTPRVRIRFSRWKFQELAVDARLRALSEGAGSRRELYRWEQCRSERPRCTS